MACRYPRMSSPRQVLYQTYHRPPSEKERPTHGQRIGLEVHLQTPIQRIKKNGTVFEVTLFVFDANCDDPVYGKGSSQQAVRKNSACRELLFQKTRS